jgi:hypothetical protein
MELLTGSGFDRDLGDTVGTGLKREPGNRFRSFLFSSTERGCSDEIDYGAKWGLSMPGITSVIPILFQSGLHSREIMGEIMFSDIWLRLTGHH